MLELATRWGQKTAYGHLVLLRRRRRARRSYATGGSRDPRKFQIEIKGQLKGSSTTIFVLSGNGAADVALIQIPVKPPPPILRELGPVRLSPSLPKR
jgi:hypothetical protein